MRKRAQTLLASILALGVTTSGYSAGVLTIDLPMFAAALEQISKASALVAKMSEAVGAARDQLKTLQDVSNGIRDLKNVLKGGVQGILGDASDQLGLNAVFTVGKSFQNLVTDGMNLYKDAKSLPDEAKKQLKDIGLAVEDVEEYLATGLVYDAFSGLQIDEWRQIAKDPIEAFANGAVGRTIVRTEAYLDTEELRKQYADKLAEMSPEERAKLTKSAGVDMAILNFASWATKLDERIAKSLNYSLVADKLLVVAGKQDTLGGAMGAGNATSAEGIKLQADIARDEQHADTILAEQLARQTNLINEREKRLQAGEESATMTIIP